MAVRSCSRRPRRSWWAASAADYEVRDLGWHRLKDLTEPEHLFEVDAPGLEREHPPLRSLGTQASLPTYATELVGRSREVAEICDMIDREGVRLVTLTGTGGTGKTRLAVAVAGELEHRLARDTYFVPLHAHDRATLMWAGIADAVSAPADAKQSPEERALQFLADRSALLVLDNLEQITDADVVVSRLLGRRSRVADPGHLASAAAPRRRAAVPGVAADGSGSDAGRRRSRRCRPGRWTSSSGGPGWSNRRSP